MKVDWRYLVWIPLLLVFGARVLVIGCRLRLTG